MVAWSSTIIERRLYEHQLETDLEGSEGHRHRSRTRLWDVEGRMTNFLEEFLAEVEEKRLQKKIELDQLKANQLLRKIKPYSTVTLFARFRGWSTLTPRATAMW